jgi:hypothetical protein
LKNSAGVSLGLAAGDVINVTGNVGGSAIAGQSITVTASTTLQDIATAVQTALRSVADGALTETATIQADGSIRVATDGAHAVTGLQLLVSAIRSSITPSRFRRRSPPALRLRGLRLQVVYRPPLQR